MNSPSVRYSTRMENSHLTLEIKNTVPVELLDLTHSFLGVSAEFKGYIEKRDPEAAEAEVKLYVQEIRSGSIIASLVAMSPQLFQAVPTYIPLALEFAGHLKSGIELLSKLKKERPEIDNSSIKNLQKIVNPIAKDGGAQLNIGTIENNVYNNVYLSLDSRTAKNVIENGNILLASEKAANVAEKVLLYWFQARADLDSKTGDKGVIESIASHPVKVVCANNQVKAQMIGAEGNPFKHAYIVDVVIETINGKAALYHVVRVHEQIEKPD